MLGKSDVIKIWCIFFWSIFAIQLFPLLFGGIANVLMHLVILFLFWIFARRQYRINFNVCFIVGILIYAIETSLILDENVKITILGTDINYSFYKMCFWLVGIICATIFTQIGTQKDMKLFQRYYLVIVFINAITNLFIVTFIDPEASRYAGKEGFAQIIGTSDYDMVYSITLLVPCFMYLFFKAKGRHKVKYLIYNLIIVLYVFKASFFIAVLAMILGIALFITANYKRKLLKYIWIALIILLMGCFVVNSTFFYDLLLSVANKINNDNFSDRISQLVAFMRDGTETEGALVRLDVYKKMLEGFVEHPLLGCVIMDPNKYIEYAGHSTILDMLCGYGLIGCVPLFVGFHSMMLKLRRRLKQGRDIFDCCYAVFVFVAVFNPVTNGALLITTIMAVPFALIMAEKENYEENSCVPS